MRERKKETNSFLVTRLGCYLVIDRRKRKVTYAAVAPAKQRRLLYAQHLDWSSFESMHYWKNPPCPVVAGGWSLLS